MEPSSPTLAPPVLLPRPTIEWVRLLIAPVMVFVACLSDHAYLTDFWQHLARGAAIVAQGRIINNDIWTFTASGQPFRDANWLTQVAFYRLFQLGGLDLVLVINAFLLAITMGLVIGQCRRASGSSRVAAAVGVVVFLGLWQSLAIRPQTVSLLLFVILHIVLRNSGRSAWFLLIPPFVLALWANVHGGFVMGLFLLAAFLGGAILEARGSGRSIWRDAYARKLLLCTIVSAFATLANPYGMDIYGYAHSATSVSAGRAIEEWMPPDPHALAGMVLIGSVLAMLVLVGRSPRRVTLRELCIIAIFLPLAFVSVRMVAWWILAIAPTAAALLGRIREARPSAPEAPPRPSWAAGLAVVGMLAACVISTPWMNAFNPLVGTVRSAHRTETDLNTVTQALRTDQNARKVFTRLEWGNFLCWSDPRDKVFAEGHIDLYNDAVWADYLAMSSGAANWDKIAGKWGVDTMVLDKSYHANLIQAVERSSDWRQAGEAGTALLFVRTATSENITNPAPTVANTEF